MSHDIPRTSLDALVKRITQAAMDERRLPGSEKFNEQFERLMIELKRIADALEILARNLP